MTLITVLMLAQVQVQVDIQLPTIRFPAPPTVVLVEPGIQVIEDQDDEVFVIEGVYWVRREGHWFKAPDHHGRWVRVEPGLVPPNLVKVPPGRYRRYKHARHELHEDRAERREDRRELREDRRDGDRDEVREDRRELKEDRKEIREDKKNVKKAKRGKP